MRKSLLHPSIIIEHHPADDITRGEVVWPYTPSETSYPVQIASGLVVELDGHFPVRPAGLVVSNHEADTTQQLERLIGPEQATTVLRARELGSTIIPLTLTDEGMELLARLQYEHPSTPDYLQQACAFILGQGDAPEVPVTA